MNIRKLIFKDQYYQIDNNETVFLVERDYLNPFSKGDWITLSHEFKSDEVYAGKIYESDNLDDSRFSTIVIRDAKDLRDFNKTEFFENLQ